MPPVGHLEHYRDLLAKVEACAAELRLPVRLEGYTPPGDPRLHKLSVTPDDSLMLLVGGSVYRGGRTLLGRQPRVSFSADGRDWSSPRRVLEEGDWLLPESAVIVGYLDEAIPAQERFIALRPDSAEAHNNLGVAWYGAGRCDVALVFFRRAVELKPDYAQAASNLLFTSHFDPAHDSRFARLRLRVRKISRALHRQLCNDLRWPRLGHHRAGVPVFHRLDLRLWRRVQRRNPAHTDSARRVRYR